MAKRIRLAWMPVVLLLVRGVAFAADPPESDTASRTTTTRVIRSLWYLKDRETVVAHVLRSVEATNRNGVRDDFKIQSELEFWNTSGGLRETTSCPPAGDTHARIVRLSPDERTIAVAGYGCVRVLDRESLRLHRQSSFEGEITDLAFAANGRWLVLPESGRLHLLSLLPQAKRPDVVVEDETVHSMAVARDSGRIATIGRELAVWNSITTDQRQRRLLRDLQDRREPIGRGVFDSSPYWSDTVAISGSGQIVAGITVKGLAVWRTDTEQVPRLISGRDFNVGSISVSRDGRLIAFVAWLHPDHLLNPKDEERPLSRLSIDPARLDTTVGDTAEVRVWDVERRETRFVKTGVLRKCTIALSDDGRQLAYSKKDGAIGFQSTDQDE